jgi:hypothetical protein
MKLMWVSNPPMPLNSATHGTWRMSLPKAKAARGLLNSNLMIADQAAIKVGFDFRR